MVDLVELVVPSVGRLLVSTGALSDTAALADRVVSALQRGADDVYQLACASFSPPGHIGFARLESSVRADVPLEGLPECCSGARSRRWYGRRRALWKACRSVAQALDHEGTSDAPGTGDVGHSQEHAMPRPHRRPE